MKELKVSLWPKTTSSTGLAMGWESAAWISSYCVQKKFDSAQYKIITKAIQRRLQKKIVSSNKGHSSLFFGLISRILLIKLAHRLGSNFNQFLPKHIKAWKKTKQRCTSEDLMLGSAGDLLAATEIETLNPSTIPVSTIYQLREATKQAAISEIKRYSQKKNVYLGLAHGLAGYLLSLEASQFVFGKSLDSTLRAKLIQCIMAKRIEGPNGMAFWPVSSNDPNISIHGWCHGGPGIALAFLACFAMTKRQEYWKIALKALKGVDQLPGGGRNFCCGSIGRAQILIEAYRITGDKKWFRKALNVANEKTTATKQTRTNRSFHRGSLGEFYLQQRLADPTLPLLGLGPLSVQ